MIFLIQHINPSPIGNCFCAWGSACNTWTVCDYESMDRIIEPGAGRFWDWWRHVAINYLAFLFFRLLGGFTGMGGGSCLCAVHEQDTPLSTSFPNVIPCDWISSAKRLYYTLPPLSSFDCAPWHSEDIRMTTWFDNLSTSKGPFVPPLVSSLPQPSHALTSLFLKLTSQTPPPFSHGTENHDARERFESSI